MNMEKDEPTRPRETPINLKKANDDGQAPETDEVITRSFESKGRKIHLKQIIGNVRIVTGASTISMEVRGRASRIAKLNVQTRGNALTVVGDATAITQIVSTHGSISITTTTGGTTVRRSGLRAWLARLLLGESTTIIQRSGVDIIDREPVDIVIYAPSETDVTSVEIVGEVVADEATLGNVRAETSYGKAMILGTVATLELDAANNSEVTVEHLLGGRSKIALGHGARLRVNSGVLDGLELDTDNGCAMTFVGETKSLIANLGHGTRLNVSEVNGEVGIESDNNCVIQFGFGASPKLRLDLGYASKAILGDLRVEDLYLVADNKATMTGGYILRRTQVELDYGSSFSPLSTLGEAYITTDNACIVAVGGGTLVKLVLDLGHGSKLTLECVVKQAEIETDNSASLEFKAGIETFSADLGHAARLVVASDVRMNLETDNSAIVEIAGRVLEGEFSLGHGAKVIAAGYNWSEIAVDDDDRGKLRTRA